MSLNGHVNFILADGKYGLERIEAARIAGNFPAAEEVETIGASLAKLDHEHQEIEEFEDDLHKHVHLENNILFPKSARLQRRFPSDQQNRLITHALR